MKFITNKYITLLFVVAGGLFFGTANAQYSNNSDIRLNGFSENLSEVEFNNFEVFHDQSPDTLVNMTDSTDVIVEIRDISGNTDPGLRDRNGDTTSVLKAQSVSGLNENKLRRGVGAGKKVELIVTIPGVKNDSTGYYDIKQVAWTLGAGHNPSYTKLNYLGGKKGYQIIFVYEKGIAPRNENPSDDPIHMQNHIQGHICDPGDPTCSPD